MSRRPTATGSGWRFCVSVGGVRGKEVGQAAITYSIFTLDPPGASAHLHQPPSDFASEEYKVHLRMQQQNASATKIFTPRNRRSERSLAAPRQNRPWLTGIFCGPRVLGADVRRELFAALLFVVLFHLFH